ncbi:MAG: patatin-like phospholipase family protein, partial [Cryomorphaceae bacterium]|nr:patatin-like phospholipase family protein [Cryomorphaceae bacterium]
MRTITLLLLLILTSQLKAQEGPRVGLVFSGGGARCLAQIGALKVMEEEGVRFDYIGGTS